MFPILNAAISINSCQFSSEMIPQRTDFISLKQFYVEEKVGVFLSSRKRHIKLPIKATETNKATQIPCNERDTKNKILPFS